MKKFFAFLFILLVVMLVGCNSSNVNKTDGKNYDDELQDVKTDLITINIKAESMLSLYSKVWGIRIKGKLVNSELIIRETNITEDELDKYFETDVGYGDDDSLVDTVTGDPQDVVMNLNTVYKEKGQIDELKTDLINIKDEVQELNDPPEEFEKVFDKLLEMYSLTEEYVDLAISPSGSFLSFNEDVKELGENIIKLKNEIEVLLPQKETETNDN